MYTSPKDEGYIYVPYAKNTPMVHNVSGESRKGTVCSHQRHGGVGGACSHHNTILIVNFLAMKAHQISGEATPTILLQCGATSTVHVMTIR